MMAQMTASQDYILKEIFTSHKLGGGKINTIYQDSLGYIYLGTTYGLFRSDGNELLELALPDSLNTKSVTAILGADNKELIIGFQNGVVIKLSGWGKSQSYLLRTRNKAGISDMIMDNQNRLWVASNGDGIYMITDEGEVIDHGKDLLDNFCYTIEKDNYERIWVGTDRGINILNMKSGKISIDSITPATGLPDYINTELHFAPAGRMWIGMESGMISYFDMKSGELIPVMNKENPEFGKVIKIIEVSEKVLILTENFGVFEISEVFDSIRFKSRMRIPGNLVINDLSIDSYENIWIVSDHAVYMSSGNSLEIIGKGWDLPTSEINAMFADSKNYLWFGIKSDLYRVNLLHPGFPEKVLATADNSSIISMYEDYRGILWIGTFNQGIYLFDPESFRSEHITTKNGLPDNNVLSMVGNRKNIWLATLSGAIEFISVDRTLSQSGTYEFKSFGSDSELGIDYIYEVFVDRQERIWFGTDGKGLICYDDGNFDHFPKQDALSDQVIISIDEDIDGNMWFASNETGIYKYDGEEFNNYTIMDGLRSLNLRSITADTAGNLIILHDEGIDIFSVSTSKFIYLDDYLDIRTDELNPQTLSIDYSGNVWISTDLGIIKYSSFNDKIFTGPSTIIADLENNMNKIDILAQYDFKHNENRMRFSFTSLWYLDPTGLQFQYKLSNWDDKWISTRSRDVSYSSLPPGTYHFKVRSSHNSNFANSSEMSYSFVIHKPFWFRIWFIVSLTSIVSGILYFLILYRYRRLKVKEKIAREQISIKLQTLQNQVNPHFLFNSFNTLTSIIPDDKNLAITYVENLAEFFRNVLTYRNKDLIPLREELKLLDSYLFIQMKRYGKSLMVDISLDGEELDKKVPPLTLQILVENAIKHNIISDSNPLSISIADAPEGLSVSNNLQLKNKPESSTRTGLQNIVSRYRLIGSEEVDIRVENDQFKVTIPLIDYNV